jgi:hypothetical protein
MKNVTITLNEDAARWARIEAAKRDISLARFVGEMIEEKMAVENRQDEALQRIFSRPRTVLRLAGEKLPTREEIYDRPGLRRFKHSDLHSGPIGTGENASGATVADDFAFAEPPAPKLSDDP